MLCTYSSDDMDKYYLHYSGINVTVDCEDAVLLWFLAIKISIAAAEIAEYLQEPAITPDIFWIYSTGVQNFLCAVSPAETFVLGGIAIGVQHWS